MRLSFCTDDPTVVEELPSESSATTEEAYSTAAHAIKLLLESEPDLAAQARAATLQRLGQAASRSGGELCQATWALGALLRGSPSIEAAAVGVQVA